MKNKTFYKVVKRILKKTKLRTLLLFIILLSVNSTAWFIYATKVENGISAKVVAWNVSFVAGDNEMIEYINFDIDNIYPGMENYTEKIQVTNNGESNAKLKYEIENARLLDNYYEVNGAVTSDLLLASLANDYPFKIRVGASDDEIEPGEQAYFYITVFWDYESGDDEADTYWGNKAYYFHEENDKSSIEINLVISAVQKNDETSE